MTFEDLALLYEECSNEEAQELCEALKKEGYDGVLCMENLIMNFTNFWPDTLVHILKFNTSVII